MKKKTLDTTKISNTIFDLIASAPTSTLPKSNTPHQDAQKIIHAAALKSAAISGAMALPVGPLGIATILPDLVAVWKIQSQMVADIAAVHGKQNFLTKEVMMYCLFKEGSQQFLRDVIFRIGDRYVLRKTSLSFLTGVSGRIGGWFAKKLIGRSFSRWLPVIGALAMGYYSKKDTEGVGQIAMELFASEINSDDSTIIDVDKLS